MVKICGILILTIMVAMLPVDESIAKQVRSSAAKHTFQKANPCPATGQRMGACPGYVIDHITPLACGGADDPSNMQWQTVADGKAKDAWERKDCQTQREQATPVANASGDSRYHWGPRGGCYTYSASGKKRYVDHSFCR